MCAALEGNNTAGDFDSALQKVRLIREAVVPLRVCVVLCTERKTAATIR